MSLDIPFLEFDNFTYKIPQKEVYLKNISFKIHEKDKVLLLGSSGIGKSSLFNVLFGFKFEDMYYSNLKFRGVNLNRNLINKFREETFYLVQNFNIGDISIKECFEICNINSNKIDKFIDFANKFQLSSEILEKKFTNISGGEKQRFGIILSIISDKNFLMLDEPTSALDEKNKEIVIRELLDLDKTMIIISHDSLWKENESHFKVVQL